MFAAVCVVLAAADAAGWLSADTLDWNRAALAAGQGWRAWTGHLVHWTLVQALLDVGVTAALAALLERAWGTRAVALNGLAWMPLLSGALWFGAPDLVAYRGASGLAVAAAWALGWHAWFARPAWRPALAALIVVGLVKLVADAGGAMAGLTGLPADVRVAWQAHAAGAALGSASAWLRRLRPHRAPAAPA